MYLYSITVHDFSYDVVQVQFEYDICMVATISKSLFYLIIYKLILNSTVLAPVHFIYHNTDILETCEREREIELAREIREKENEPDRET